MATLVKLKYSSISELMVQPGVGGGGGVEPYNVTRRILYVRLCIIRSQRET